MVVKRGKGRGKYVLARTASDALDLVEVLRALPPNPIPWLPVVKLVAPFIARLAIRYALKRMGRTMSQDKINRVVGSVKSIIEVATDDKVKEKKDGRGAQKR